MWCKNYLVSVLHSIDMSRSYRDAILFISLGEENDSKFLSAIIISIIFCCIFQVKSAMLTSYWLAKEDLPVSKYSSLVKLQKAQGCEGLQRLSVADNASYDSRSSGEDFQQCIAEVIHEDIIQVLRQAEMFIYLSR